MQAQSLLIMMIIVMLQVPREDPGKVIQVTCSWSNTANTLQAISMDEDDDSVLDSIDEPSAQVHCVSMCSSI